MKRSTTRLISFLLILSMMATFLPVSAVGVSDDNESGSPPEYNEILTPGEEDGAVEPPVEDDSIVTPPAEDDGITESPAHEDGATEPPAEDDGMDMSFGQATMAPSNSLFYATYAANDLTIPGYTQVTRLNQIKADRKYLIVAQAPDGTFYALYLNADGANKSPGSTAYPQCAATLNISENSVSAVSTANTANNVDMDTLHVTIAPSGNGYTIKNVTHSLALNSAMYASASTDVVLTLSFVTDSRFNIYNPVKRCLTFNVSGDSGSHFPDHPTGFCGWNDPQPQYRPIYLFIEGELPSEPGENFYKMLEGDKIDDATGSTNPDGQNSWVFTGGRAAQGSFADIAGARSYAGHFEEYIRYTHAKALQPSGESTTPYFQRHVINTAYEGQTLADIVNTFDTRIGALKPRAVSYLVDENGSTENSFEANLGSLIDKSLALQGGEGLIVIGTLTAADKAAVDAVVNARSAADKANIKVVEYSNISKTGSYPNANGHFSMAKQLAAAVTGNNFDSDTKWPFTLANSVMDNGFPNKQTVTANHTYTAPSSPTAVQTQLKNKMNSSASMTWLFMGDSITHGSAWAGGYDTLAQLFEKFVKDDLSRKQDIVINAGSSGATTASTISDLDRRLTKYSPDVVVLMLGTNDAGTNVSTDTYKTNLRTILNAIISKGAIPVLRTPPPTSRSGYDIASYAACVREVAAETAYKDTVILVDQYKLWTVQGNWQSVFSRDTLHPDEAGHLWFLHQLIYEMGLWGDSYNLCQLEYMTMQSAQKITLPGFKQVTDVSELDASKGYLIVSQAADGSLYALYPSEDGKNLGAGSLPATPTDANNGARTATLAVNGNTVTATAMKGGAALDMEKLLFRIQAKDGRYEFTSFDQYHLNMADKMFTEGIVPLTITDGTKPYAFNIRNPEAGNSGRILELSVYGDPNAWNTTLGTDFWCPTYATARMPMYFFASNTAAAPTAKDYLKKMIDTITAENLVAGNYTAQSWSAFQTVLNEAKALANGNTPTDGDDPAYSNMMDKLEAARNGLLAPISTSASNGTDKKDWKSLVPTPGTTTGQPFPSGTGGSTNFRIPAIITLQNQTNTAKNGRLVAAIDARWNHTGDGCSLDTILSYSDDNGANWNYLFPNYFGDSTDAKELYSSAFIDPVMVEGLDGTIYMMVDIWPGGIDLNTADGRPANATGYAEINGKQRLVLYTATPDSGSQTDTNYSYYVGDFTGSYAPVKSCADNTFTGIYVDAYYYLYYTSKDFASKNPASDKMWCERRGESGVKVQQNVFFQNAMLHVRAASYLWVTKSTDGGETWSAPNMINGMVRTGEDRFYGVGPGAGLCIEGGTLNGMIILPTYANPNEHSSFVYSRDNGATWTRGPVVGGDATSESCLIQINDTTIRHFFRDSWARQGVPIHYVDHTWNGSTWVAGPTIQSVDGTTRWGACQLSAIKYSKQIDGKDVIMLSAPGSSGGRKNGKIFVLTINNDAGHTMTLYNTYEVNGADVDYAYSSLTETENGDIALLYEVTGTNVPFKIITYKDLTTRPAAPEIPGYTQVTDMSQLDMAKSHIIVSRAADGSLYALYPSVLGETLGAGALVAPGNENEGARAAQLTINGNTVTAAYLKDGTPLTMDKLYFKIEPSSGQYVFTAANGRHLNMNTHMFTEGTVALTVTSRGAATFNAFEIKNPNADGGIRVLDFTKTGDPNQFVNGSTTYGTDFWSPRGCNMNVYLFASTEDIPTAKSTLQKLVQEIEAANLQSGDYVRASWAALQDALKTAKAALSSAEANEDAAVYVNARDSLQNAYDTLQPVPVPTPVPEGAVKKELKDMVPVSGTTQDQPFPSGTGGSENFRIPAIITLQHQKDASKNGRLVAAIDARWNHVGDACCLDTILSYSDDNGDNWKYLYANYFGDSTDAKESYSTAFIDPVMVEGLDGTIYMMVDIWPGGIALNTAPHAPADATGYAEIDGKQRLVLYTAAPGSGLQTDDNYSYYVGDFLGGYAPVVERVEGQSDVNSKFYVDQYYYLYYNANGFNSKSPSADKVWCQRLGENNVYIQQNVFFQNALLHVRAASYLWITKSTDGGETWGAPVMANGMVRGSYDGAKFYGVGPGAGLCIDSGSLQGTIILPTYTWPDEHASFIYSQDSGKTWTRGPVLGGEKTSESCLIQIDDTTVRHFFRNSWATHTVQIEYVDHTWNPTTQTWTSGERIGVAGTARYGACQLSAIKHSKQIDGRDVIFVSLPAADGTNNATGRRNGKIYALLVNNDAGHTMELYNAYEVNGPTEPYGYSSLTETENGDIALLYEVTGTNVPFQIISYETIIPSLNVTGYEGVYDGEAHSISVSAPEGAAIQYSTDNGTTWTSTKPEYTDVGIYTVQVKAAWDGTEKTASGTVEIKQVQTSIYLTSDSTVLTKGQTVTLTITGVPAEGTVTLDCPAHGPIALTKQANGDYIGTHKVQEGTYDFVARYTDPKGNYADATSEYSITVYPELGFDITVHEYEGAYDGQPHSISVKVSDGVAVTYSEAKDGPYTSTLPAYTNVGRYTVYYKAASANGKEVQGSATVVITKATPKIAFTASPGTDITTAQFPLTLTINGVPDGSQGKFTLTSAGETVKNLRMDENGIWIATPNLPIETRTYTFVATFDPSVDSNGNPITNPNYERIVKNIDIAVTRTAVPTLAITPSASTMNGGGTLTLTVSGIPGNGTLTVTCDRGLSVTETARGKYTVTLPNATQTYTFTAVYTGEDAYNGAKAICTVSVTEKNNPPVNPDPPVNPNPPDDSSSSDSSDSSSSSNSQTAKNPDGSTTTTVTDKRTGTVTETTVEKDGSKTVVETKKDGTVTTTTTDKDGGKVEKVTTPSRNVTITVTNEKGETMAKVDLPFQIPEPDKKFVDVPAKHWAEQSINAMAGLGVIQGVGNDRFDMNSSIKRGDLAAMLYRLSNGKAGQENKFSDVPNDKYYADAVAWANMVGVVQGDGKGSFRPENTLTREEMAVMLCRYAALLNLDTSSSASLLNRFTDNNKTHGWAKDSVAWCVEHGIIQGKGNGVLDPAADVTRAETASMLQRFLDLVR